MAKSCVLFFLTHGVYAVVISVHPSICQSQFKVTTYNTKINKCTISKYHPWQTTLICILHYAIPCINQHHHKLHQNSCIEVTVMDVNETRESQSFFSIPRKEFLDFREPRLVTAQQQAYCEWDNCHLSFRACYQSIASRWPWPAYHMHGHLGRRTPRNSGVSKR